MTPVLALPEPLKKRAMIARCYRNAWGERGATLINVCAAPRYTCSPAPKSLDDVSNAAVLAEFERNLTAKRTTGALQYKKATAQKYTNQTPYGFEAIEGRLVQVLAETEVVAEIQAARSSGNTLQSIAENLNGRGIPTKTGKQWAPAPIHLLLKRTALVNPV